MLRALAEGSQHWSSPVRCAQPANQPRETPCPSAHGSHPSRLVLSLAGCDFVGKAHTHGFCVGHGVCVCGGAGRENGGPPEEERSVTPGRLRWLNSAPCTALACLVASQSITGVLASQSVFAHKKKSVFFRVSVFVKSRRAGRPTRWWPALAISWTPAAATRGSRGASTVPGPPTHRCNSYGSFV